LRLLDLQFQLLETDIRDGWKHARTGIVLGGVGAIAVLAALPVLLFGISEYLRNALDISLEAALILIACLVIVAGLALAFWSLRILTRSGAALKRSSDELRENLAWFRSVLNQEND
jgi:NhaP-type Na+/H+ or K+/H+ antiporter